MKLAKRLMVRKTLGDPLWSNVRLLVQAPESGSVISDATGKTVGVVGNTVVSTGLGYPSILFDGNGDRLDVGGTTDFAFMHNGGAWTLEAELRPSQIGNDDAIIDTTRGTTSNSGVFVAYTNSKIYVFITRRVSNSYVINVTLNYVFAVNTTSKICITYDPSLTSGHLKLYVDGTLVASGDKSANAPSTASHQQMMVGMFSAGAPSAAYTGHMRWMRITEGVRYTGDHTPPVWPLPTA